MAVLQMQRINIYAPQKHRKAILEALQRKGAVEIENLKLEDSVFSKEETAQKQAVFMKSSASAGQAYAVLKEYFPEKKSPLSMFEGRSPLSVEDYYAFVDEAQEIMRVAFEVNSLRKEVADNKAEIIRLRSQIEALEPWKSFNLSMRFPGTKTTSAFIGVLPEFWTYEAVMEHMAQELPETDALSLEIVSATEHQTCIFLLCRKQDEEDVSAALRSIGYAKPPVASKYTPTEHIGQLENRIKDAELSIDKAELMIKSYRGMKNAFRFMEDYYVMRAEKYGVIEKLENSKHVFILTGYIVKNRAQALASELNEKYGAAVELEAPSAEEQPPVVLKNNKFARPVESVLETYSLPGKGEVDPTSLMSIFYYIFFGMMFSDAGYGLVLALGCAFVLKKFKNMEQGLKKSV